MAESLTQRWLRQNISAYRHRDIVYTHVDAVLVAHPTLRPKTDVYTYDDGRSQLLLCIHGLLPIVFRRVSYNIPIAIWLTHQYPSEPPIVYVVPTSDMLVKASKYVQVSGLCTSPYIETWRKKSEGSSLTGLAHVLIEQFSQESPVYAKPPAATASPQRRSTPDHSRPPPPPRPTTSATSPRPPTPPPRPPPHAESSAPGLYYGGPQIHSLQLRPPEPPGYVSPPIPPHPHQRSASVMHQPPPPPHIPHYTSSPSYRWSSPVQQSPDPSNSPYLVPHHVVPPSHAIPAPLTPSSAPAHAPPPAPSLSTPTPNLLDEDIDPSTLSTSFQEAVPPPRPPNPEILHLHAQVYVKFTAELANLHGTLAADMQRLQTTQVDLLAGEPAIRDEMARLEAVRDVCTVVRDRYKMTVQSAEGNVSELRKKGDPEVDELICSTTIVYNQLIDLIAEDNAIEDTIYHLHRALNAGRIDLDKFLRTTRSLAEEQFMKRALAEKIASSIPMGVWH